MKTKKIIILSLLFTLLSFSTVFASNTEIVRVGLKSLYSNVSSAIISNDTIEIGYSSDNIFTKGATISADSAFYVKMPTTYFVKLPTGYSSYEQAKSVADTIPNGLVGFNDTNSFNVLVNAQTEAEANTLLANYAGGSIIAFNGKNAVIYDGNDMAVAFTGAKNAGFKGEGSNFINVGSRNYRGYIEVYPTSTNTFTLVNVIDMEEYLYSVVPSEMPASWNIEALKAQAVAARTYASKQKSKHLSDGYNLCDTTDCQMYLGADHEYENSTNAVNATKGVKAYYNGALIDTVFSSSSGGVTANSEDVWVTEIPYLREKPDPYDTEGMVWERQVTTADLTAMLADRGQNIGTPTDIRIDEVSNGGRVNKITILGTNGEYSTTKESIRSFFSINGQPSLPSRLFTITSTGSDSGNTGNIGSTNSLYVSNGTTNESIDISKATVATADGTQKLNNTTTYIAGSDSTTTYTPNVNTTTQSTNTASKTYTISGKGYGHGVGMSQYGAKGMAEQGFGYVEILKFYYDGIDVY